MMTPATQARTCSFIPSRSGFGTETRAIRARRVPSRAIHARAAAAAGPSLQGTCPALVHEVWADLPPHRFIEDKRVFLEDHRVRATEAGPDQRITILAVADLLQEAAGNHAVAMWGRSEEGFATDPRLSEAGLIFVMTRMHVEMLRYPRWGDLVRLETWFQQSGKVGAERQWLIRDSGSDEVLGKAVAQFVMVNWHSRRLAKMPDEIREHSAWFARQPPKLAISHDRTRARLPDVVASGDGSGGDAPSPGTAGDPCLPALCVAKRCDMDMNGHVNNVAYLGWLLESVPQAVYANRHLRQVELDFKAEATAGQLVRGFASPCELPPGLDGADEPSRPGDFLVSFAHSLQRESGGGKTELARARTTWQE